jgi:hypothetical protein
VQDKRSLSICWILLDYYKQSHGRTYGACMRRSVSTCSRPTHVTGESKSVLDVLIYCVPYEFDDWLPSWRGSCCMRGISRTSRGINDGTPPENVKKIQSHS